MHADLVFLLPFLGQLPKCCISELQKGVGFGSCTDSTFTELLSSFSERSL